jgi:hypothetical protein
MLLWRPLQDLPVQLESGHTPATACILHCNSVLDEIEQNMRNYPAEFERGNLALQWCCQMMGFTLITMLRRHRDSMEPFTRVTRLLNAIAKYWPSARALLRAMFAIAMQLRVQLPEEARQYCVNLEKEDLDHLAGSDIPISWAIPRHADFQEMGGQDDDDVIGEGGIEVAGLISKWAALAVKR